MTLGIRLQIAHDRLLLPFPCLLGNISLKPVYSFLIPHATGPLVRATSLTLTRNIPFLKLTPSWRRLRLWALTAIGMASSLGRRSLVRRPPSFIIIPSRAYYHRLFVVSWAPLAWDTSTTTRLRLLILHRVEPYSLSRNFVDRRCPFLKTRNALSGRGILRWAFMALCLLGPMVRSFPSLLTRKKNLRWADQLAQDIKDRSIDHASLDNLIGKLSFAQTTVFGKFVRPLDQPLYGKLHESPYRSELDSSLIATMRWRMGALMSAQARAVSPRPRFPKFIVYTDASWPDKKNKGMLDALLFNQDSGNLVEVLSPPAPASVVRLFRGSVVICGLELFALVSAFAVWQDVFGGFQITAFVDNDPLSQGFIRGSAPLPVARYSIRRFWQRSFLRSISIWIERVPPSLKLGRHANTGC